MKKYLAKFDSAISDRNFPLWVLATIAILTMPTRFQPIAFFLVVSSVFYRYLKLHPGALNDRAVLFRPEIQKAALIGFVWLLWQAGLPFCYWGMPSQIAIPLILSTYFCPLLAYIAVVLAAGASHPKASKSSEAEDEGVKAKSQRQLEHWTHTTCAGYMSAFVVSMIAIACFPYSLGKWVTGWLLASGIDANLPGMSEFIAREIYIFGTQAHPIYVVHEPASVVFGQLVSMALALLLIFGLWPKALKFSAFLTIWTKKTKGTSKANPFETFISTIRAEKSTIELKRTNSFKRNLFNSATWLISCYLSLFLFFGFCGGPLGKAISGWMNGSLVKAFSTGKGTSAPTQLRVAPPQDAIKAEIDPAKQNSTTKSATASRRNRLPKTKWYQSVPIKHSYVMKERKGIQAWIDKNGVGAHPNLRVFLAAIIALYGTVPLSVMGAVFLPYLKRKKIVLSKDAIFLPENSKGLMGSKALRLWSELASVNLKLKKNNSPESGSLEIRFHDKSKVELKIAQMKDQELETFLSAIDENSPECSVSDEVLDFRHQLRTKTGSRNLDKEISSISGDQFQSTIFQTHEPGAYLPDGETRIVRLLASRPLSCVYLVRRANGKLGIAKQFFLAGNDEETEAMRKCLQREYELLGKIDHPSIAKVLEVFQREESTYLLLEHVYGTDLRTLVSSQGGHPEAEIYDWAIQICDIMTYLHSQDPPILHRDLTPDNLVLTEEGKIRVIDFGAAQRFVEGITGTIIGKQCYVPPEQLQGHASVRSDIYSFAGVLQFLLTGEDPVALTQSDPSLNSNASAELSAVVKQCSEFDESLRPESFEKVKELLMDAREKPVKEVIQNLRKVAESQDIATALMNVLRGTQQSAEANSQVSPKAQASTEAPTIPAETQASSAEAPAIPAETQARSAEAPAIPAETQARSAEAPAIPAKSTTDCHEEQTVIVSTITKLDVSNKSETEDSLLVKAGVAQE